MASSLSRSLSLPVYITSRKVEIQRFFHRHPLILATFVNQIPNTYDICKSCRVKFTWGDAIYCCDSCEFYVHKSCGELPKWIKSLLHHQHLLKLVIENYQQFECNECRRDTTNNSSYYGCKICDFTLDIRCAAASIPTSVFTTSTEILSSEPPKTPEELAFLISSFPDFHITKRPQIHHFSDPHPLVLSRNRVEYAFSCCFLCRKEFQPGVLIYACHDCDICLHCSCTELPRTIRNTLHLAHPLVLTLEKRNKFAVNLSKDWPPNCHICDTRIVGSFYNCALCRSSDDRHGFALHIDCAFTHDFDNHQKQDHKFILFKPSLFTCDGCGVTEYKERVSCVCMNCPLQVHKKCSISFPPTVKQIRHPHKLNLTYPFQMKDVDFSGKTCRICYNKMNNVYCMYQCTPCGYIAHVSCVTSSQLVDDDDDDELRTNKIEEIEGQMQVEHFSHPHSLIFTTEEQEPESDALSEEEEPKSAAYCDACVRPVSVPFYTCPQDECNFYLHKQCFGLPLKIQHPLHAHPLTLKAFLDTDSYSSCIFACYGCGKDCNGFAYASDAGGFKLDVHCSLVSDTLKHDGHACPLTLIDYVYVRRESSKSIECSACEYDYKRHLRKFFCEPCNFHLDLGCATLPKTVTHECPKHDWKSRPLYLTYGAIKDGSGIYYCDMCENPRGENHWFYDCGDNCKWSNHPRCVLGKDLFKYGKTYGIDIHEHNVKLVKITKSYPCGKCRKPTDVEDAPFHCATCDIYFHRRCSFYVKNINPVMIQELEIRSLSSCRFVWRDITGSV